MAKNSTSSSETPLMQQHNAIKAKYPEAILLFRVGDFYETFGEDAVKVSKILGIVLTKRKNGAAATIDLAGFPYHSLDNYLPKLVRAGFRVAVCDQLEDPKMTKTIVKRGVTELVTPGVVMNDLVLDSKKNNFLAALHVGEKAIGVALVDISTGEFLLAEGKEEQIDQLLQNFRPSEIIFSKDKSKQLLELVGEKTAHFKLDTWIFTPHYANELLNKQFETVSLKGFGVESLTAGIVAAGAILHYLTENHHDKLGHITKIARIEEDNYVWLDRFTVRNLELVHSHNEQATLLIDVIDKTLTPMGGRLVRRWLLFPLKNKQAIEQRLNGVAQIHSDEMLRDALIEHLSSMSDLERLASKVAVGKVNPKELLQLKKTLETVAPIKLLLAQQTQSPLAKWGEKLSAGEHIIRLIEARIDDEAAIQVGKGKVIADGYNQELDELRSLSFSGKDYLEKLQEKEAEASGIPSLKIAFNNVFGYYIEVRNTHKDKVPDSWIRKQTLVNAERYITEELKLYETKILGAEEKIHVLESQILQELIASLLNEIPLLQQNAHTLATLDCLTSFAVLAKSNNYCKPELNEDATLNIKDARHPVIEQLLPIGEHYIANDVYLDTETQQIIMITGPNMSGKSAILRQTALIVLMAQMGSFVPASFAQIGIVDKLFTRVGASDNISGGESTFMVEMNETASILNNLSKKSLVLLDEIGRGTSTYDGISIAWAIAEYLHEHPKAGCKTLFATHYHELNEMTEQFDRIKNFNVSVKEIGSKVIFIRKLLPGGSEHSFGIHVAKMAGMPIAVVDRATKMLRHMEKIHKPADHTIIKEAVAHADMQLSMFQLDDPVLQQIKEELIELDINTLTPVEALMKLNEIKRVIGIKTS